MACNKLRCIGYRYMVVIVLTAACFSCYIIVKEYMLLFGVRFENAYGGMFCSPARASLLTGYHDLHTSKWEISRAGLYSEITRGKYTRDQVENAYDNQASTIPENEVFLAEIFKKSGYVTAQVGKLDWGFATTHKQLKRHGWDYYYGYY